LLYDQSKTITLQEALERADGFISTHRNSAYGYELRGRLMLKYAKEIHGSIPYFARAEAIDLLRPRPYYFLAVAHETIRESAIADMYFNKMLDLDSTWFGGLSMYTRFLEEHQNESFFYAGVPRLYRVIQYLATLPPESSTTLHTLEHQSRNSMAKQLFARVKLLYLNHDQR